MFSPLNVLRKIKKQYDLLQNESSAERFFEVQKAAIEGIKWTAWYEEIHDYFAREFDLCVSELVSLKSDSLADYKWLQARIKVSKEFLEFLENIVG